MGMLIELACTGDMSDSMDPFAEDIIFGNTMEGEPENDGDVGESKPLRLRCPSEGDVGAES